MAYTKRVWECGDVVTDEDMNRIEQGIEDAQSKDYECTETKVVIADDSVTTSFDWGNSANGSFSTHFTLARNVVYIVTFDGVEYECELDANGRLGDRNFVNYPFSIIPGMEGGNHNLYTENEGTYSVKIEGINYSVNLISQCFYEAIIQCVDKGYDCQSRSAVVFQETITTTSSEFDGCVGSVEKTWITDSYPDYVDVTFNGTEYRCPSVRSGEYGSTGDFSDYPFRIGFEAYQTELTTPSAGTYQVTVKTDKITADSISPCFKDAVLQSSKIAITTGSKVSDGHTYQYYDITFSDLHMATAYGQSILLINQNSEDIKVYRVSAISSRDLSATLYTVTPTGEVATMTLMASDYDQPMYEVLAQ